MNNYKKCEIGKIYYYRFRKYSLSKNYSQINGKKLEFAII